MPRWYLEGAEVSLPDIRTLVPHAGPMVLLDRLIAVDEDSLCAEVAIRRDGPFCGREGVGAWVGIEYMAQAIAAHAGHAALLRGEPVKIGFLVGTRRYHSHQAYFRVGAVLRVEVKCLLFADNGLGSFDCKIFDRDREVAKATVMVFLPRNVEQFLDGGMA
jgi:predicted hotdog family 3-hydroxylacyl-ACP dehydratase